MGAHASTRRRPPGTHETHRAPHDPAQVPASVAGQRTTGRALVARGRQPASEPSAGMLAVAPRAATCPTAREAGSTSAPRVNSAPCGRDSASTRGAAGDRSPTAAALTDHFSTPPPPPPKGPGGGVPCSPNWERELSSLPKCGDLSSDSLIKSVDLPSTPESPRDSDHRSISASWAGPPTLLDLVATPGLGARLLGALPLLSRLRARAVCRSFRDAVDESLATLRELSGDRLPLGRDGGGGDCTRGMLWLVGKCPNLASVTIVRTQPLRVRAAVHAGVGGAQGLSSEQQRTQGNGRGQGQGREVVKRFLLSEVATHCKGLQSLHVDYDVAEDRDGGGMMSLVANCRGLRELHVGCGGALPWLGQLGITDTFLEMLAANCRQLEVLSLDGCPGVTDAGVTDVVDRCGALRHVAIGRCPGVTDASMRRIGARCRDLVHLEVRNCEKVTDEGMKEVAAGCRELQYLKVGEGFARSRALTDASIVAVGAHCHQLRTLKVDSIGDEGAVAIAQGCPHLQKVRVRWESESVTDVGVKAIGEHCQQLRVLRLAQCNKVTDAGIAAVATHCHDLTQLDVCRGGGITDASITLLAENCPGLKALWLRECQGVSDESLIAVASRCPGLVYLRLSKCTSITDAGLMPFIERGKLQWLEVPGCPRLSPRVFQQLGEKCRKLAYLDAGGCDNMTRDQIKAWVPQARVAFGLAARLVIV